MRFQTKLCRLFLYLCLTFFSLNTKAQAATTFRALVEVNLCPEYRTGNYSFTLAYTVDSQGPTLFFPQILSSTVNAQSNSAKFEIILPKQFEASIINLFAYCTKNGVNGSISNVIKTSSCLANNVLDSDGDGLRDSQEDIDCSNGYSELDPSNFQDGDSDGDGVSDLEEFQSSTNAQNPGDSPKPIIVSGQAYDPNFDGVSNPVLWNSYLGAWKVSLPSGAVNFNFGNRGETPFTFRNANGYSVGVVKTDVPYSVVDNYPWKFYDNKGIQDSNGIYRNYFNFGKRGDHLFIGPWVSTTLSTPAVARVVQDRWRFYIATTNFNTSANTFTSNTYDLGEVGDVPRPADYDGDGKIDPAVLSQRLNKLIYLRSSVSYQKVEINSITPAEWQASDKFWKTSGKYFNFNLDLDLDGRQDIIIWDNGNLSFFSKYVYYLSSENYLKRNEVNILNSLRSYPLNAQRLFDTLNNFNRDVLIVNSLDSSSRYFFLRLFPTPVTTQNNFYNYFWGSQGDHQG